MVRPQRTKTWSVRVAEPDDREVNALFREVDEDLRKDNLEILWKKYGTAFIGVVVALVLSVAGFQIWKNMRAEALAEDSSAFIAAAELAEKGRPGEAASSMAAIAAADDTEYALLARLRQAAYLAGTGDVSGAIAAYDSIIADSGHDPVWRDLAIIKQALLTLDTAEPAALEARLAPLAADQAVFRHSAREALALVARRQGQDDRARDYYRQLAEDATAPQAVRGRAAEMLAALGGGATDGTKG